MLGPALWSQIYCQEIEALFKRKYIDWANDDVRGDYYRSVRITAAGVKAYEDSDS